MRNSFSRCSCGNHFLLKKFAIQKNNSMCQFQSLYFEDDGYVVRCKQCNNYQLAFGNMMITLSQHDFDIMCKAVQHKCAEENFTFSGYAKCIVVPTPSNGMHLLLTKKELTRFNEILEEADNEAKAQSLISLFSR